MTENEMLAVLQEQGVDTKSTRLSLSKAKDKPQSKKEKGSRTKPSSDLDGMCLYTVNGGQCTRTQLSHSAYSVLQLLDSELPSGRIDIGHLVPSVFRTMPISISSANSGILGM